MFEPSLKSVRWGGRQIAITSGKDRRVSFDLVDFYHNRSRLIGVDSVKFTGPEIAAMMNELRVGFEEGHLQAPAVSTWPMERAVEAYETVDEGLAPNRFWSWDSDSRFVATAANGWRRTRKLKRR